MECDSRSNILRARISADIYANRILSFIARRDHPFPRQFEEEEEKGKVCHACQRRQPTGHKEQVGITVGTIYRWYSHKRKHDANVWSRVRNLSPRFERKGGKEISRSRQSFITRAQNPKQMFYPTLFRMDSLVDEATTLRFLSSRSASAMNDSTIRVAICSSASVSLIANPRMHWLL